MECVRVGMVVQNDCRGSSAEAATYEPEKSMECEVRRRISWQEELVCMLFGE